MCLKPYYLKSKKIFVPCGKCVECDIQHSVEWAIRIQEESRYYDKNCFVTLTYNDDNLPENGSLCKRDLQLFMKRLRKHFAPQKLRFFACGEYGENTLRAHYHIILFNCDFVDKYLFQISKRGEKLFRSSILEKLWSKGFSSVGEVNFETAKYCAKYCMKGLKFDDGRLRPFVQMSRRPGIAYNSIRDELLISDKLYYDSNYIKLPRYFLKYYEKRAPEKIVELKEKRNNNATIYSNRLLCPNIYGYDVRDSLEKKQKKFLKIFGKSLDSNFILCYNSIVNGR